MISWYDHALLATKLTRPQSYIKAVVPRPRLYSKLELGADYPLTLLSAPAGFGKTTLLTEWLNQRTISVAWVSLERNDNEAIRFWSYITAALEKLDDSIGEQIQELATLEDMLAALINTLVSIPHEIVLILDDYHTITSAQIHQSVEFFLEHLPQHVHLFILTREDPPLALARLRVHAQLYELKAADLRFTLEETALFLTQSMELQLSTEEVVSLQRSTEGWIAGLQLAAFSLHSYTDPTLSRNFIKTFTGTNKHIFTYLQEEVLTWLPAEILNFLLATTILTCLHAPLCDAVTEQHNASRILEWLEHANLFLTPLDEQGDWYRYHPLFADLLYHRLQQEHPEHVSALHLRASTWYEQHAMPIEAIEHALATSDFEHAATLLESNARQLTEQGQILKVQTWLTILEDKIAFATYPLLSSLAAENALHRGQIKLYTQYLHYAEQESQTPESTLLRAYGALHRGDGVQAITHAQRALAAEQTNTLFPGYALTILGTGHLLCGDIEHAQTTLNQAQRLDTLPGLSNTIALGDCYLQRGHLQKAAALYQRVIQISGDGLFRQTITAHCQCGEVYYEWDNRKCAEEHLQQAQHIAQLFAPDTIMTTEHMLAARLAWMRGEFEQAIHALNNAETDAQRSMHSTNLARITTLRVQYLLAQGKLEEAMRLPIYTIAVDETIQGYEARYQAQARILIAQGQTETASALLEPVLQLADVQGRVHSVIALLVLLMRAYHTEGDIRRAKYTLERALMLAEASGYRRTFVDEGEILPPLLLELYHRQQKKCVGEGRPRLRDYMLTLLTACGLEIESRDLHHFQQHPRATLNQLSEREQDVLKLIAAGHSNQQIARSLVVAESTIKTHLNNIYTKLNVNSRLQALTKAHAFGLLEH